MNEGQFKEMEGMMQKDAKSEKEEKEGGRKEGREEGKREEKKEGRERNKGREEEIESSGKERREGDRLGGEERQEGKRRERKEMRLRKTGERKEGKKAQQILLGKETILGCNITLPLCPFKLPTFSNVVDEYSCITLPWTAAKRCPPLLNEH